MKIQNRRIRNLLYRFNYKTGHETGSGRRRLYLIKAAAVIAVLLLFVLFWNVLLHNVSVTLYQNCCRSATVAGRYLIGDGRYPKTLYLRILDSIPALRYSARSRTKQSEDSTEGKNRESAGDMMEASSAEQDDNTVNGEETQTKWQKVEYSFAGSLPEQEQRTLTDILKSEGSEQSGTAKTGISTSEELLQIVNTSYNWKLSAENERFISDYYMIDPSVGEVESVISGTELLNRQIELKEVTDNPQILIYHTHGTESYIDSRDWESADTVVGAGDILTEELTAFGFHVLHDRTTYDYVNGQNNRSYAYSTARPEINELLEAYPSIEVILDPHRDSGAARTTVIDGVSTAQIMFFNGLSKDTNGPIESLYNKNLEMNLAFSLQINILGRERYPGLMYRIYLKNYRYNMHLAGRYMLVELGTEKNTVAEAANGARLLARLLFEALLPKEDTKSASP